MRKTLTSILLLVFAHVLLCDDETPSELVKKLGDSDYQVRQNAYSELLAQGYFAREAVSKALSSSDPETKERARELWKTLRWMLFPKAGKDIAPSITKLENKNTDREIWEKLYTSYAVDIIFILLEMHADKKFSDRAVRGFSILLEKSDPAGLAAVVSSCADRDTRESLMKYLAVSRPENLNSELCIKMLQTYRILKLYDEALEFGEEACKTWKRDPLLLETAKVVKEGKLEKLLWEDCAREIMGEGDAASRENVSWFYITMAAIMSEPERISAVIDAFDGKFNDASILRKICRVLAKIRMYDELLKVTESKKEPVFAYARSVALAGTGRKDEGESLWNEVVAGVMTEEACYELGEFMDEVGDERSEKVWMKILEVNPEGKLTVYDVNAYLKIAPYCEKRGEYDKAAEYYEKAIEGSKGMGAFMVVTSDSGRSLASGDAEKYLRDKISELRKKKQATE